MPANWSMHRIGSERLAQYMAEDRFATWLRDAAPPDDASLTCQRWLNESGPKRYCADLIYGDLLYGDNAVSQSVLDVGGGLSTITRALARRHSLTLVDIIAHDAERLPSFLESEPSLTVVQDDWFSANLAGPFDIAIAVDIFPNVDQRLQLFLQRVLPIVKELRLALTIYNAPRFYFARRVETEEVLCMLGWDGAQTASVLSRCETEIFAPDLGELLVEHDSVYANGRQVILVRLKGQRYAG